MPKFKPKPKSHLLHKLILGLLVFSFCLSMKPARVSAYDLSRPAHEYIVYKTWENIPQALWFDIIDNMVSHYADVLDLTEIPKVHYYYKLPRTEEDGSTYTSHGYYDYEGIHLNLYCFTAENSIETTVATIAHECRHRWQHEFAYYQEYGKDWYVGDHRIAGVTYNNTYVNTNRDRIIANITDYQSAAAVGHLQYKNQLIERDARWFEKAEIQKMHDHLQLIEENRYFCFTNRNKDIPTRTYLSSLYEAYMYQQLWALYLHTQLYQQAYAC